MLGCPLIHTNLYARFNKLTAGWTGMITLNTCPSFNVRKYKLCICVCMYIYIYGVQRIFPNATNRKIP